MRFTVADTGIGMPAEFLERIFDPFERSDQPGVDGHVSKPIVLDELEQTLLRL